MSHHKVRRVLASSLGLLVMSTLLVIGAGAPASACSCMDFESVVRTGDHIAVFVGEVIEEDRLDGNGLGDLALVYEVESVYRGEIAERVIVHTTGDVGAGCGLGFRGRTAVLAYLDGGHLVTNSCSAMPLLEEGGATLALLDETFGAAGSPSPSAPSDDGPPVGLLVGVPVFAGLLLLGIVLMLRARDAA
jgi:hypothetical protein